MKTQAGKAAVASKPARPVIKAKPAATVAVKSAAKPGKLAAPKAPAKPAIKKSLTVKGKAAAAEPVKASAAKAGSAPVKPVKPVTKVQPKESVNTKSMKVEHSKVAALPAKIKPAVTPAAVAAPALPVKPVAQPEHLADPSVPVRTGRPSSRLAQLTVPSMAQSVASTAAKASFTKTLPAPLIIPPLVSSVIKDQKLANNWKTKPVAQLSDAEVIAMPDDTYMNDVQLAFFRLKLLTLKHDILSNAGETTQHLRTDTVVVPDPADRATIEEEHALELRTRDRERKLLKKIDQSIARIDSGDYGYCDETGEPIGVGRLLARPTANLSLEAQQRRELKQRMFGD